jgi:hypothetical protein
MRTVGADPSTGDNKRIYDTAIQVESEVLKLIAPKGTTNQVQQEIVATAVDVVSLPGKSTNASALDNGLVMDQFVKAVGDLNDLSSRRIGSAPRDSQWKMNSRNALDRIKTPEELMENTDELLQSVEEIVSNMEMAIKDILLASGWTLTSAETYCTAGLMTRLTRDMLNNYILLHQHLYQLYMNNPSTWEETGLVHLQYFAKMFLRIRRNAINRFQMWLQTYVALRDARAKGFIDVKLLGQILTRPAIAIPPAKVTAANQKWDCSHCHTKDMHEGGSKKCPAHELSASTARRVGRQAQKLIADDPESFTRLIAETTPDKS